MSKMFYNYKNNLYIIKRIFYCNYKNPRVLSLWLLESKHLLHIVYTVLFWNFFFSVKDSSSEKIYTSSCQFLETWFKQTIWLDSYVTNIFFPECSHEKFYERSIQMLSERSRNVLFEYSLNIAAERSLNIPFERSWNVPQEHSKNIALERSKNPDIFLVLGTFRWNLPNIPWEHS